MIVRENYMSNLNSQLNSENESKEYKKTLAQELEGMCYEEMGDFFDTHSMTDYWDETEPVEMEMEVVKPIKVRHFKYEQEMEKILAEEIEASKPYIKQLNSKIELVKKI